MVYEIERLTVTPSGEPVMVKREFEYADHCQIVDYEISDSLTVTVKMSDGGIVELPNRQRVF